MYFRKSCFVATILYFSIAFSETLNSTDIENLGISCSPKDRCIVSKGGVTRQLEDPRERLCLCDNECAVYGDCCLDAKQRPLMTKDTPFTCRSLRQFGGVYLKNRCDSTWSGPAFVADMCELNITDDATDPLSTLPSTNSKTGITYKNHYCAMCNNDVNDLVLWTVRLECEKLSQYNFTRGNLTKKYVEQNLVYNPLLKTWGIELWEEDGKLRFYDCYIDPIMPSLLESRIRLCKPSISGCIPGWPDEETQLKCESYTSVVYHNDVAYRNPYCAFCNLVNITELSCHAVEFRTLVIYRSFQPHSFAILLDVNDNNGQDVGLKKQCHSGEVFDPFFKKCRNIFCGLKNYVYRDGKCIRINSDEDLTTIVTPKITSELSVGNSSLEENQTMNFVSESHFTYEHSTESNVKSLNTNVSTYDKDFLLCPKIFLSSKDYEVSSEGSIYAPRYNQTFLPSFYINNGSGILICMNFSDLPNSKFTIYMGYVTIIGLGISIVCLLMHLLTYALVPDLQNLSGKNLASLTLSLLAAYSCFIIGQIDSISQVICTAIALLTYYFFLASFFWMSAMSFDVWRTLRMATTELRVSGGKQWKRFLLYSLYSWIVPMLIVMLAFALDNLDYIPIEFRPGFGITRCWFKRRKSLLVFFASPLIVIMIVNIILFVSSARMIISTTKRTLKHHHSSTRRNFKLYLRLALIMGLTWCIGLVAGYVDLETLWYLFVILNTLQGLFIFVAFSCTKKVFTTIKDRLKGLDKASAYRSSSLNSGSAFNTHSTIHSSNRKASIQNSSDNYSAPRTPVSHFKNPSLKI